MDEIPAPTPQEVIPPSAENEVTHTKPALSLLDHRNTPYVLLLTALVIAFVGYIPCIHFEFVYDDTSQILRNAYLDSWHWKDYFTKHVWAGYAPDSPGVYYRPMFLVWARMQVWLFGIHQPPIGWHLCSILLQLSVVALFFAFVRQLTGRANLAAWATLLFAAHPVHLEPVVWISGSPELLLGFFTLLTLMCYVQYIRYGGWQWLLATTLSFAGALFSKETAVVVPAIAYFLSDYLRSTEKTPAPEIDRSGFRRASMLACSGIVLALFTYLRVHAVLGSGTGDFAKGWTTMALTFPTFVWFYVQHLVFPWPVSPIYDPNWLKPDQWWWMVGPLCASVLFIALLISRARKDKLAKFTCWLMLLPMVPALIGIINFYRYDIVHDRYLYLTCMGWCIWLALLVEKYANLPERRFMAHVGLITVAALFAQYGIHMAAPYRNNIALFEWAVQCAPQNHLARQKLGDSYMLAMRYDDGINMFKSYYQPGDFTTDQLMGSALYAAERYAEAEEYLQRAATSTDVNPAIEAVPYNWAILGMSRYYLNKFQAAELAFRNAIALNPSEKGYHYGMGRTLEAEGKLKEARVFYAREVQISNDTLSRESILRIDTLLKLNARGKQK